MLRIRNLVKAYTARGGGGQMRAIDDLSFDVARGEFFTLLGPSGCGKTTTLQCLAGLETPTSGTIEMDGTAVYCSDRRLFVPANRRNLGMVFQSYAIWPHLSVFDNVAFPLVHGPRRQASGDVRRRVMQALERVKLQDLADRPSPHLSGGQQQRVALARALVHEPAVLLLDEPLSNLDAKLRDTMRIEIRQLVTAMGITTIFVTHDQLEALSMSDTIVLMRGGRIVQKGTPREVYLAPTTAFAAEFMGRSNLIACTVAAPGRVETAFGSVACICAAGLSPGDAAFLIVRPHNVRTGDAVTAGARNVFSATIVQQSFLGDLVEADVTVGGQPLRIALDAYVPVADGTAVPLEFPADRCIAVAAHST